MMYRLKNGILIGRYCTVGRKRGMKRSSEEAEKEQRRSKEQMRQEEKGQKTTQTNGRSKGNKF
jgi:hypothetical protein